MNGPRITSIIVFFLTSMVASADTVRLKSGEAVYGNVENVSSDLITLKTAEGKVRTFPRKDVASVHFGDVIPKISQEENFLTLPTKPESPFASPGLTFQTWRKAATLGDVNNMVKCYASFKQDEKKKELKKLSKDVFEKMRTTALQTDFAPSAPLYQGDRATMVVNWTKGLDGGEQILQFILEKNDWKILQ